MGVWEIIGGLAALAALVASIVAPILKLNTSITSLTCAMGEFKENLKGLTDRNSAGHDRLWAHLGKHNDALSDHETRIQIIEKSGKGAE